MADEGTAHPGIFKFFQFSFAEKPRLIYLAVAIVLLMGAMMGVLVGSIFGMMPSPTPAVVEAEPEADEIDRDGLFIEDFRPIRGIDLARERSLSLGGHDRSLLAMLPSMTTRGRATDAYGFASLEPDINRELHRPMSPKPPSGELLEVSAVNVSAGLADAGRLGGNEPILNRSLSMRDPGPADIAEKSPPDAQPPDMRLPSVVFFNGTYQVTFPVPQGYNDRVAPRPPDVPESTGPERLAAPER